MVEGILQLTNKTLWCTGNQTKTMTIAEKQLVEWLELQLRKTENILSALGKKRASTLTKEDGDQWVTLSFRKRWLLSQIDSIIQK